MPYRPKKPIPWAEAEILWRQGMSEAEIGRRFGCSRQAVNARAKNEGWERGDPRDNGELSNLLDGVDEWPALVAETETVQALADPSNRRDRAIAAYGARSAQHLTQILRLLERGSPRSVAARAVGLSADTLRSWLDDDESAQQLVDAAEARATVRRVDQIDGAAARGDWRGAAWLLERSPASRDDFGGHVTQVTPQLAVQINVTRGDTTPAVVGERMLPRADVHDK